MDDILTRDPSLQVCSFYSSQVWLKPQVFFSFSEYDLDFFSHNTYLATTGKILLEHERSKG